MGKRMNWTKWKIGALVSVALSLFVAGAGLTAGMDWRGFVAVFCAACVTHFGSYIKDHPVSEISFDTEEFRKAKQHEQTQSDSPGAPGER